MRDSHFHLNCLPRTQLPALIDQALARGCGGGLVAGIWNGDTQNLMEWARQPGAISPALRFLEANRPEALFENNGTFRVLLAHGLHPAWLARHCEREDGVPSEAKLEAAIVQFAELLNLHRKHIAALGEIGFDAHPHTLADAAGFGLSKPELLSLQVRAFEAVVTLAMRERLPVIVHSRGAWGLTLDRVLRVRAETGVGVMIHCYSGPAQDVHKLTDSGIFLSFGGVPTWRNARRVREAFLACPDEYLLVETDAPDLPLEFEDGTRPAHHEPAHLADVVARLATLRGVECEALAARSDANLLRYLSGK